MTEDNERKLSPGRNDAGRAKRHAPDVSPLLNNYMGYTDENDSGGGIFDRLKKAERPGGDAFAPQGAPAKGGHRTSERPDLSFGEPRAPKPVFGAAPAPAEPEYINAPAEEAWQEEPVPEDGYYDGYDNADMFAGQPVDNGYYGGEQAYAEQPAEDNYYGDAPIIGGNAYDDGSQAAGGADMFAGQPEDSGYYGGDQAYAEQPAEDNYYGDAPIIGGNAYDDGSQAIHDAAAFTEQPAENADAFAGFGSENTNTAAEPEEEGNFTYVPDEHNSGAAFTMRTLDDGDKKKAPTVQPEYGDPGEEQDIAAGIAKLRSNLTVRAVMLFFAAIFSIIITSANDLELPMAAVFDRKVTPSAYLFTNTILGILSIGFAYSMVTNGIKNLIKLKPDSDSLAAMSILSATVAGIPPLFDPEPIKSSYFHLYTSVAILGMFFNTLGKLSIATRAEKNFRLLQSIDSVYAIRHEDEQSTAVLTNNATGANGEIAFMKKTGFVKDFIKNSYSSDLTDLFAEKTALLILGAAIAAGVLSFLFDGHTETIQEKLFVFLASVSGTLKNFLSGGLHFGGSRLANGLVWHQSIFTHSVKNLLRALW